MTENACGESGDKRKTLDDALVRFLDTILVDNNNSDGESKENQASNKAKIVLSDQLKYVNESIDPIQANLKICKEFEMMEEEAEKAKQALLYVKSVQRLRKN